MLLGSSARRSHAGGPGRPCRAGGDRHVHVPRGDVILPRRRATSLVQYWRWERDIGEPIELNPTDFAYWLNSKTTASRVWLPLSVPAWIELVLKQNPSTPVRFARARGCRAGSSLCTRAGRTRQQNVTPAARQKRSLEVGPCAGSQGRHTPQTSRKSRRSCGTSRARSSAGARARSCSSERQNI